MFSEESAFFLLESSEPFPVDLDDAITWWDCRTKEGKPMRRDNIIVDLKADFIKDVDYIETFPEISGKVSGRPKGKKYLSIDCFKQFGMMISGARGRDIRRHFLNCEAELKRRLKEDETQKQWKIIKACVLPEPRKWEQMFPKEFRDKMELVTGKAWHVCAWLIGLVYKHQYPKGVHEQIIGQNPRDENGNRRYKTHQFLTKDIGITALDMFKAQMVAIMDISPIGNYAQFRKNMNKVFSSTVQLELPLFDDDLFNGAA